MPKIRLTYWWDGHAPGDEVEVDPDTARSLIGRVAVAVEEETRKPSRRPPEPSAE